ncbi:Ubiquinone biosynthesis O-methyltransferase, mitochondrial [Pseudoalteromonas holothuriae]|uniref:Ubiquinone biosynthesis O-methyltransferase, mitochondrial n=1 Tax=Pseudoalteromonas holothuriae TaxID=2963714 RepID=A0ABM9GD63_9GAMM|nr:methyltransferase domain-containing protein [Pseudoalteromonas sp. CIP111951]CAH9049878.1 Ubiquinone biosynthesis O-methyltransferase, mitochondrial [Pseudoalteromonas sp. CIP111951]
MSKNRLKHAQNLMRSKQYTQAAELFVQLLDEDYRNVAAFSGLAQCYLKMGRFFESLGCAIDAVQFGGYQQSELISLLNILKVINFTSYLKPLEKALHEAIKYQYLEGHAVEYLRVQLFAKYEKALAEEITTLDEPLESMLADPTFCAVIERAITPNHQLEKVILLGRKELLRCIANNLDARKYLSTMVAIACQNLLNDGIYFTSKEELTLLNQLDLSDPLFTSEVMALKLCYASFDEALELWQQGGDGFSHYKMLPIAEDLKFYLSVLQGETESNSELTNETSKQVQTFYKANPYPKYKVVNLSSLSFEQCMTRLGLDSIQTPNILIAGCGTGLQVVETAFANLYAQVTAIDISPVSMQYAQQMVKRYKLQNVRFELLDILEISKLSKQFDFILCTGVLHHMASPQLGLSRLSQCLKSNGLMILGFYSSLGRRELANIRAEAIDYFGTDEITKKQLPQWRNEWTKQQKSRQWFNSNDFFNSNGLMDAVFHPQEINYSLETIDQLLNNSGIEFKSMAISNVQMVQYKQALDEFQPLELGETLTRWEQFEKMHPDFFFGMYNFFAVKNNV